jgi:hypothetical protein
MEVSRDKAHTLGISPPTSASVQLQANINTGSSSSSSTSTGTSFQATAAGRFPVKITKAAVVQPDQQLTAASGSEITVSVQ